MWKKMNKVDQPKKIASVFLIVMLASMMLASMFVGVSAETDACTKYVPFSWSFTKTGTSFAGAYVDNRGGPGTSMSDSKTFSGSFIIKRNFIPPEGDWVLASGETIPTSTTFTINAEFTGALSDSTLGFDIHGIPFETYAEARAGVTALDIAPFSTVRISAASTAAIDQDRSSSPISVTDGQTIPFNGYAEVETLFGLGLQGVDWVTAAANVDATGTIDAQSKQIKYIKKCPEGQWCEEGECVPEASTLVLFAVGLLFLTGYIGLKRRKTK